MPAPVLGCPGSDGPRWQGSHWGWSQGSGSGSGSCSQLLCPFMLPVCQNCIEVDAPTISGIVVADVIATVLLMVAVYCISGQDKGRMSRGEGRALLAACASLGAAWWPFRVQDARLPRLQEEIKAQSSKQPAIWVCLQMLTTLPMISPIFDRCLSFFSF